MDGCFIVGICLASQDVYENWINQNMRLMLLSRRALLTQDPKSSEPPDLLSTI